MLSERSSDWSDQVGRSFMWTPGEEGDDASSRPSHPGRRSVHAWKVKVMTKRRPEQL